MQSIGGQFRTVQPRQTAGFDPRYAAVDPAPSRLRYKLNRWFLSPLFWAFVRVGLPGAIIMFLILSFLSNDAAVAKFNAKVTEAQTEIAARPEYQIDALQIEGASPQLQMEVTRALGLSLPASGLDVDMTVLQENVLSLAAVDLAQVVMAGQGVLKIAVSEIPAVAVWRTEGSLKLIAADGSVLRDIDHRGAAAEVPLLAGAGAPDALSEAGVLYAEAAPIHDSLRGLVRVGERRWDLVLSGDRRIALPEVGAQAALRQVLVLAQTRDLLDRDIAVVDFRAPHRPTIRLKPEAVAELRAARGVSIEGFVQ